ncbi:MAG: 50S ribosomal protein L4 [Candidatus Omnitrophica bacterium]|nr:50S ribosomal protein L4 [Candidatus Omnitrophota bacterium]
MTLNVFNVQGEPVSQLPLDEALWGGPVNLRLLSQAVAMYRTNRRAGTASTKTRAHVSGGGKKPWKQKHTGRARAGSIRSPLWRHGGVVFGPHPRGFFYRLPQAIRRRALQESLKGKLRDEELVVVDALTAEAPKTKPFAGLAKAFGVARKSVIVLDEPGVPLVKSLRNLAAFELRSAANLNAFDVLNAHKVLLTKSAFEHLQHRVKGEPDAPAD